MKKSKRFQYQAIDDDNELNFTFCVKCNNEASPNRGKLTIVIAAGKYLHNHNKYVYNRKYILLTEEKIDSILSVNQKC